jgi:alkylation response protein AidB-like acyl-CoA dehydrogenase
MSASARLAIPAGEPGDWLARARRLADGFAATAGELDATGAYPAANFAALHAEGLVNLVSAAADGGAGASLGLAHRIIAEIARGEPSTALILSMHYVNLLSIQLGRRWPVDVARAVLASGRQGPALINALQVEPEAGSPSYGTLPRTLARKTPEGWRVTGHKRYATGGALLHWYLVLAVTDEAEPRLGSFVIGHQSPGTRIQAAWNTTGMRATNSHDVVFEDVLAPEGWVLDLAPASAGRRFDAQQWAWFMVLIGSVYHGIARAARDEVLAFAASFRPGSLGAPLASLPLIQDQLGEIEILLEVGDRLLESVARDADDGRDGGNARAQIRHVVLENAIRVVDIALRVAGNTGISRDHPLERHHRNVLCGRTHAPNGFLVRAASARAVLAQTGGSNAV